MDGDCWNTLGHVLWKKKDLPASKKAFEMALEYVAQSIFSVDQTKNH